MHIGGVSRSKQDVRIAILGCGWLGLPLGTKLAAEGYQVKGSTTSNEKLSLLNAAGIIPYKINLGSKADGTTLESFLRDTEILIITIPPNRKFDYYGAIRYLVEEIIHNKIRKVLYISSTSVYQDAAHFPEYTEEHLPAGQKGNAELLLQTEKLLRESIPFKTSILRLGGLLGPERHPVNYLSGRKEILNPEAPVNLVHQEDCINAISQLIKKDRFGEVFNIVNPFHPPRAEYYTRAARKKNLEVPQFVESVSVGKVVSSRKIMDELNFEFKEEI